ncbi:iron chelate uptake ABC transporter family permease subunit [Enterococcus sp.]|uniref:iron chelate uptake ABC transporter family permease subunit n=1 Tax=Enterococcus sp. TaxID=35783 RepID=UPI0028AA80D9|nr:iron chelate uptake ABC transporter family permease subunit [Enterococcus sp.]
MKVKVGSLFLLSLCAVFAYLTYNTYGNWSFAFALRGRRLLAFGLVAIASSFSTFTLQTMTQNRYLTPGILGLDQLYVLIQTLSFFLVGGIQILSQETTTMFLLSILATALLGSLLIGFFYQNKGHHLFLLLMAGMICGTMFSSYSTFLQVLMDPNEYDMLQGRLFASFNHIHTQHLLWAAGIILLGSLCLVFLIPELNVLHLGRRQSVSLGIPVPFVHRLLLFLIALLTGTASALVGPTVFLGFVVVTITYQVIPTFRHGWLFLGGTLIAFLLLVFGQFFVEQVFCWTITVNTVIQFLGGLFFISKLILERKKG